MKYLTKDQLKKKYAGRFVNVYPHHHEYWNEKIHQYETVYEVRGVSKVVKENYQTVEKICKW